MAMTKLQSGDVAEAADLFDAAARAHIAVGATRDASRVLASLCMVRKILGDIPGALQAGSAAVHYLPPDAPNQERGMAFMNWAGVLDRAGDRTAWDAWSEASRCFAQTPLMMLACAARAAGAARRHGAANAFDSLRWVVDQLGSAPTGAVLAGMLGAFGESAGMEGTPLLAQAVLIMKRDVDAFNPSNAPFWQLLIERVGPGSPMATSLCVLGLFQIALQKGAPQFAVLQSRANEVLRTAAAARGSSVDAFLEVIRSDVGGLQTIETTLGAIAAGAPWFLPWPRA